MVKEHPHSHPVASPTEIDPEITDTARDLAEYARTRDSALRERLALRLDGIVHWLARRYARDSVPLDDLIQVGRIGLLQALDRYDPDRGTRFVTYAVTMISGEIKHYFRDMLWDVRVPRDLQELYRAAPRAEEAIRARVHRTPTLSEVAAHLGVPEERIAAAMELGSAYQPRSLSSVPAFEDWDGSESLQDRLGGPDPELEAIIEFGALRSAMQRLDRRKRWILRRRYFEEWTQTEVARELGISQMHVSRLEREALGQLRRSLGAGA
jgi:RNA polymerase sigma-B factor